MRKKKGSIRYSNFVKGLLFVLSLISLSVAVLGTVACLTMGYFGVYDRSKETVVKSLFDEVGHSLAWEIYHLYNEKGVEGLLREYKNASFIYDLNINEGGVTRWGTQDELLWSNKYSYYTGYGEYFNINLGIKEKTLQTASKEDVFVQAYNLINAAFWYNYTILGISIVALLLTLLFGYYLLKVTGRKPMSDEIQVGFFAKWPFEIYLALVVGIEVLAIGGIVASVDMVYGQIYAIEYIYAGIILVAMLAIFLGFLMNLAVRVKSKTFWKNCTIWRVISFLGKMIGKCFKALYHLFTNLPLIWKTVVVFTGITIVEFIIMMACYANWIDGREALLVFWFLEKALLFPAIGYIALSMRKLKEAGENLAEGNLNYQVETKKMFWDFKEHGETLNRIGEGIGHAVDERLKSERFKTELITNVSHDIKTPLTSIINYSDLICKEETDNENIKEYSEVLYRQSSRLKKLIEDLVDASKASTGSVEVNLAPCEVGVMLEQVAGEFETRLLEKDIDLIIKVPEETISIMADGRHLWRVFDNLMNNICKYAQNRTRVYLAVEKKNDTAVISFKNISEYPLDLSSEELMERFVRGDKSRHTEGNGLGLSIAQSLTELQGGMLELVVDGDLFKVLVTFPLRNE